MIVSVHIPKTGGHSFEALLTATFGAEHVVVDHGSVHCTVAERDKQKARVPQGIKTAATRILPHLPFGQNVYKFYVDYLYNTPATDNDEVSCIHGHFPATKYQESHPSAHLVTWVRDPAQRLASLYYFWNRTPIVAPEWFIRERPALEEFMLNEKLINDITSVYMDGISADAFSFVGVTERYDESIDVFRKWLKKSYNIEVPHISPRLNANPARADSTYDLPQDLIDRVYQIHDLDFVLYRNADERLNSQLAEGEIRQRIPIY